MNTSRTLLALVGVVVALFAGAPLHAQETSLLSGTVLDAGSGAVVPGAILRVAGTNASAVSDEDGRFVLRGLPVGPHTLELRHADYGVQSMTVSVSRGGEEFSVAVRVSPQGIAIEILAAVPAAESAPDLAAAIPVTVTDQLAVTPVTGPAVQSGTVIDRERILQFAGASRDLGELIRRAVPTLQVRESDASGSVAGTTLCLEFRGTSARSMSPGASSASCHHPSVYLDGVTLTDPAVAYSMTSFEGIQWIQAIPPGQADARFGSSTYGVILIATTNAASRMGAMSPASSMLVRSRRSTFDWEQDPNGHSFLRTFLGAAVGNAAGLAAGLAVGRQCVYIEEGTDEIATSCSNAAVAGVGVVAFALPAMGSALGAHYGGRTSVSAGRWVPAVIGAAMAIFPGYAFSLSTVGGGVSATNNAGKAFLLVGTPLFTTLADRFYRKLTNP